MVMRKFRKSLDNGAPPNGGDADDPPSSAVNSPRAPRKSKGPSLPEGLNDGAVEGQGGYFYFIYSIIMYLLYTNYRSGRRPPRVAGDQPAEEVAQPQRGDGRHAHGLPPAEQQGQALRR